VTRRLASFIAFVCLAFAASPAAAQHFFGTVSVCVSDYPAGTRPGPRPLSLRLRFELARTGAVVRCVIVRPSGNEALDAASCRILQERARFRPARGGNRGIVQFTWLSEPAPGRGNPRGGPLPFALLEMLSSDDYPAEAVRAGLQGTVDYDVDVSETGVARACRVVATGGSAVLDRRTCQLVMARAIFIPASDGQGGRRAGTFNGRLTWRLP
jgi:TonB family protein